MISILLLLLGLLAGVLSGLFGIGGGVVIVPMLFSFFGLAITQANATSLAALLLPVGILGVYAYYKAGLIDIKKSLWIAVGLTLGSAIGAEFAVNLPEKTLKIFYAVFLAYIAFNFLEISNLWKKEKPEKNRNYFTSIKSLIILGFLAGIIAGMFGKGGGIVIVPALIAFWGFETKQATGTSLAALQLPVGLPGVIVYAQNGQLNFVFAGLIALGILIGAFFGTKLAIKLPSKSFKKIYGAFLISVIVLLFLK